MAISLEDTVKAYADALRTDTGKRVWLSRTDVQPPGYLVALDRIDYVLSGDVVDLTLAVFAVCPDVGEDESRALEKLDELHAAFINAGYEPEGTTTVVGLNIPAAAKPVPALQMTVTVNT